MVLVIPKKIRLEIYVTYNRECTNIDGFDLENNYLDFFS
jgi:hypothetical protein